MVRLDRFLTLRLCGPMFRPRSRVGDPRIPILMYHSIAEDADEGVSPYYRTVTRPATFRRHMQYIDRLGFQPVTLATAARLLASGPDACDFPPYPDDRRRQSPATARRPLVITFDDGFRDFYTNAFPILDQLGFGATVFLSTAFIDGRFPNGRDCLKSADIQELAQRGVEFGSHTVNHPQLARLDRGQIRDELAGSKARIEAIVHGEVAAFSYPFRFPEQDRAFVAGLRELLTSQGYTAGVTTAIGVSTPRDDPLFRRRLPMNDCDDWDLFRAKLAGAYDWLHQGQLAYKRLSALYRRSPRSARNETASS